MALLNTFTSLVLLSLGLACVALALGNAQPAPLVLAALACLTAFALCEYDAPTLAQARD